MSSEQAMSGKKAPLFFLLVLLVSLASVLARANCQPPERPMLIYGNVTLNGNPPPNSLSVIAKIAGQVRGAGSITDGQYQLAVSGSNGEVIDLYLNNLFNGQQAIFNNIENGGILELNLAFIDTTPPTTPQNIRVTGYTDWSKPNFAWDPSTDDTAVLAYVLRINDVADQNIGNVTQWAPSDPLPLGSCTIRVGAVDAAGNQGQYNSIALTIESYPGAILLTISPSNINLTAAEHFTIIATASSRVSGQLLVIWYKTDSGDWIELTRGNTDENGQLTFTWTPPAVGVYYFMAGSPELGPSSNSQTVQAVAIPEFSNSMIPLLVTLALVLLTLATRNRTIPKTVRAKPSRGKSYYRGMAR